jgi:hypothetical protein
MDLDEFNDIGEQEWYDAAYEKATRSGFPEQCMDIRQQAIEFGVLCGKGLGVVEGQLHGLTQLVESNRLSLQARSRQTLVDLVKRASALRDDLSTASAPAELLTVHEVDEGGSAKSETAKRQEELIALARQTLRFLSTNADLRGSVAPHPFLIQLCEAATEQKKLVW